MDLELTGKVALITGSTKGIGRAVAERLAAEGCHLGICARNQAEVDQAISELSAKGVKVVGGAVDVASADSMGNWVEQCASELGGIDIFVSNVSAGGADASEDGWRANFETDRQVGGQGSGHRRYGYAALARRKAAINGVSEVRITISDDTTLGHVAQLGVT